MINFKNPRVAFLEAEEIGFYREKDRAQIVTAASPRFGMGHYVDLRELFRDGRER